MNKIKSSVKLSDSQLNKQNSAAKKGVILRINIKMFDGNNYLINYD